MEKKIIIANKLEYGDDWVGWLSYAFNKKETMNHINELYTTIAEQTIEISKLIEEKGLLEIKLKDKNKVIRELKKNGKN
jgi:agmatine/peptidylarginine deiminase